ncbi:MAG TPA: 7-cyano-7-deazaguanine synthase QueC [Candidatus Polarisedimenticolia bacterium]|nr:7-cyano-7-deazaguanine synthase QueC [Candidatus Polarisedimenticolia bacterium]
MTHPKAVVLVSGGMDSCVTAAIAAADNDAAFLHVSYGQRTERKERSCFDSIADHFNARRLVARLDHLREIGGSSLTDPTMIVPEGDPARPGIPSTYVPFRNGQLLSIAAAWAEVLGARRIFIGAVEEDATGYPDCRRTFYDAFQRAIEAGTRPESRISIETPVIHMTKSAIVTRAFELGAPLHLTWSCYRSEQPACGRCDSCVLRLRAFAAAGRQDPLSYG